MAGVNYEINCLGSVLWNGPDEFCGAEIVYEGLAKDLLRDNFTRTGIINMLERDARRFLPVGVQFEIRAILQDPGDPVDYGRSKTDGMQQRIAWIYDPNPKALSTPWSRAGRSKADRYRDQLPKGYIVVGGGVVSEADKRETVPA